MKVCHVVRRYGPVGGMESYVFYLTRALADLQIDIVILCEEDLSAADHPHNLKVHAIGVAPMRRPRWKAMQWFRDQVQTALIDLKNDGYLIHSHERIRGHHITTQHGPLMSGRVSNFMAMFSRRVRNWLIFEKEELDRVIVLPVSDLIGRSISSEYPESLIGPTVWPAMGNGVSRDGDVDDLSKRNDHILFVGRDFKRKGLDAAIKIVDVLRRQSPDTELHVFGVSVGEVPAHMRRTFVIYHGWIREIPYHNYKVLIHPAKIEPYGMCIAEALSANVLCLVSKNTGALGLKNLFPDLPLYDLDLPQRLTEKYLDSLSRLLLSKLVSQPAIHGLPENIPWSWKTLAQCHLDQIYPVGNHQNSGLLK